MASVLYRMGGFAFGHRRVVLLAWVVVLAGVAVLGVSAPSAPPDTSSIPGAEFQRANDLIQRGFHANPNGATAQIVLIAPRGQKITAARYRPVINAVVAEAGRSPQVAQASNPLTSGEVSKDASTAIATISYTVASGNLSTESQHVLHAAVARGRHAGLTVEIGGDALHSTPFDTTVVISLVIAALILLITFNALAAAGLPLLTALIGVGVSLMAIIALGRPLGLPSTAQSLGLMLGLAVGIDYALFIVFRYREERARGRTPQQAAALATGTAGSAVVFAGLTVIIALVGLSVIGIPTATKMGFAAAGTVAVAVLIALTLIPALLGFFQRAVMPRTARTTPSTQPTPAAAQVIGGTRENLASRWVGWVQRHPVWVLVVTVVGLAVVAIPALSMRLGEPGNASLSKTDTARRAYDDISRAFGPGYNGQLTIVVSTDGASNAKTAVATVARKIAATPDVVSVSAPQFNSAGSEALINVIPATAPDASRTTALVHRIRAERPAIRAATGVSYLVTGLTAANIDIAQKVSGALIPYLLTVIGLAFLLLLVVFRSLLIPLKATVGFLLSVLAGLGALVAVFQWGWLAGLLGIPATGPIQSLIPIFLVGISFGLSMDYEVFLVTRIHEAYTGGQPPREAVRAGFSHSGRVVTAAALIMISVFAGFITSSDVLVKMIGFGLAVTVLLDAFVDRMTIGPAVFALLDKAAWWQPRWLDTVLPRIDIEGHVLERRAAAASSHTEGAPSDGALSTDPPPQPTDASTLPQR